MKSITIHGLDEELNKKIQKKALEKNQSLNKTIKNLLAESLGGAGEDRIRKEQQFMELFGTWTKAEEEFFNKQIEDLEKVICGE